jgi:hypothetical protein
MPSCEYLILMRKGIGFALCAASVLIFALCMTLLVPILRGAFWGDFWGGTGYIFGAVGAWLCCAVLFPTSFKLLQPTADQLLLRGQRPPVLFLRSFEDEQASERTSQFGKVPLWFPGKVRHEVALAFRFGLLGPVIAVGRPRDRMPQLGASRLYVPDGEWQDTVGKLMQDSGIVLVLAHQTTDGLGWEIDHAVKTLRPEQFTLYFRPVDDHEREYQLFKIRAERYFPHGLPATLEGNRYVLFGVGWSSGWIRCENTSLV